MPIPGTPALQRDATEPAPPSTHAFAIVKCCNASTTITAYSSSSVEEIVEVLFSCFSMEAKVHLTHGDLLPRDIPVQGSKITGIIDQETARYYPDF
jgi:hypothetical protein